MVKYFLSLFLLLSFSLQAATLTLTLNSHNVEMGKFILATFIYDGKSKTDRLDLELWNEHFFVQQGDVDVLKNELGRITSITKARLYPRHTGDITLDAIASGGAFVTPKHVHISPSMRNQIDATPIIKPLKNQYWADEAIEITVDVPLHFASNEVIAKEWELANFNITALPIKKSASHAQLKWLIYTPYKGHYTLELPAIIQRGHGRFRFHLPPIRFHVKPLPSYYPSSIASGKIDISSKVFITNKQTLAQITFKKRGFLPSHIEGMQAFISQLSDDELDVNINEQQSSHLGITTRIYTITLPPWLMREKFALNIMFFNPVTGQLETLTHHLPITTTLPKYAQYGALFMGFILFFIGYYKVSQIAQVWRSKQQYKKRIKFAESANGMRLILLNNGEHKSLKEWSLTSQSTRSNHISSTLNNYCFCSKPTQHSLSQLKEDVLSF